jgi:hypothetical protein
MEYVLTALEEDLEAGHAATSDDETHFEVIYEQNQKMLRLFEVRQCSKWFDMIIGWAITLPIQIIMLLKREDLAALAIVTYFASCL